jgi:hypothetical protein
MVSFRFGLFSSLLSVTLGTLAIGACGGSNATPAATPATADAGRPNAPAGLAPLAATVTIPPERGLPATTLGSKVAKVRGRAGGEGLGDAPLPACLQSATSPDPTAAVGALAKACAPSSKPVGSPSTLSLADAQAAVGVPLAAEAGACYRLFAAAEPKVENLVLVILDSKGAVATEARANGRALVAPTEGPLCFDAADAAKVVLTTGRGAGRASLQISRE